MSQSLWPPLTVVNQEGLAEFLIISPINEEALSQWRDLNHSQDCIVSSEKDKEGPLFLNSRQFVIGADRRTRICDNRKFRRRSD